MPCYSVTPVSRRSVHFNPWFGPQTVSVVPRFSSRFFRNIEDDFAPFENFFKELEQTAAAANKSFQPRFDLKEESDKFVLHGELPGVQPENLSIDFVDRNTMVVKGKVVRQETRGTPPAEKTQENTQEETQEPTMQGALPESEPEQTTNYHKASVEDEGAEASESTATTPAAEEQVTKSAPQEVAKPAEQPQLHYWVSERSVGEFSRVFRFPGKVNQDEVKAALKDGILTVSVPKQAEEDHRKKIEVQ